MIDVVIDASALIQALLGADEQAAELRAGLPGMRLHAPHLIDAEVGNVLRRRERSGVIGSAEAQTGLLVAAAVVRLRYPHAGPLSERAWALRDNLTFYDALYVALAEQLAVPLLTADARLAAAPRLPCAVTLV